MKKYLSDRKFKVAGYLDIRKSLNFLTRQNNWEIFNGLLKLNIELKKRGIKWLYPKKRHPNPKKACAGLMTISLLQISFTVNVEKQHFLIASALTAAHTRDANI